ncbi:hypothetical protein CEK62_08980 [Alcanivorax sp. N3-2A]|nr:hypothetical protein CEK62_08980 [Alcanivorax sp. N3-2A]|tara:strand:+ start:19628 stop:20170 length:543 start_codon:yes stop_codon:yes gene_type:complete
MVDDTPNDPATRTPPPESEPPPAAAEAVNEKLRRLAFWSLQYWRELFSFKFDKYMIIQVIPGVYGVALVGIGLGLLYLCVDAFTVSTWRGLFFLFIGGPIGFLVLASTLRALLEFYMVVFKISQHVDELAGLRDTVDRLSGISDSVDEMVSVTRRIPFWKALSGGKPKRRADGSTDRDDP